MSLSDSDKSALKLKIFKNMASNISNERVRRRPSYEAAKIAEI